MIHHLLMTSDKVENINYFLFDSVVLKYQLLIGLLICKQGLLSLHIELYNCRASLSIKLFKGALYSVYYMPDEIDVDVFFE